MALFDSMLIKIGLKKSTENQQVQTQPEGVLSPVPGEATEPAVSPIVTGNVTEGSAMLGSTNLTPTPEGTTSQTIGPLSTPDTTVHVASEGLPTTPDRSDILPEVKMQNPIQSPPGEVKG